MGPKLLCTGFQEHFRYFSLPCTTKTSCCSCQQHSSSACFACACGFKMLCFLCSLPKEVGEIGSGVKISLSSAVWYWGGGGLGKSVILVANWNEKHPCHLIRLAGHWCIYLSNSPLAHAGTFRCCFMPTILWILYLGGAKDFRKPVKISSFLPHLLSIPNIHPTLIIPKKFAFFWAWNIKTLQIELQLAFY